MANTKTVKTNTVKSTEVEVVKLNRSLLSVMNKAAKLYDKIKRNELEKLLPQYKQMGEAFLALREAYPSNAKFKEACEASPLADVTRQDRNYWMELASNWDQIEELRAQGIITGRSPQTTVRQLKDYLKELEAPESVEGESEDGADVSTSTEAIEKIASDALARALKNGYTAEDLLLAITAQAK